MSGLNTEAIALALIVGLAAALITWLFARRHMASSENVQNELRRRIRELEEQGHAIARHHLQELRELEGKHYEDCKVLRARAVEEGRALGTEEARRSLVSELTTVEAAHSQKLSAVRDEAYQEGRERTRIEMETHTKMYDVSIRPYLKIDAIKGFFGDKERVESGYQYQLLVNGAPAFQPAIVIEESRTTSKLNEERIQALLENAERAAKAAAEVYLGTGASMAKLGPAVLKRLLK